MSQQVLPGWKPYILELDDPSITMRLASEPTKPIPLSMSKIHQANPDSFSLQPYTTEIEELNTYKFEDFRTVLPGFPDKMVKRIAPARTRMLFVREVSPKPGISQAVLDPPLSVHRQNRQSQGILLHWRHD